MTLYYPNSNIEVKQGDILYSTIGRSTYYVGHTVMIGSDYLVKESIPGKPSGHSLTINQMWNRHRKGDKITLLRAPSGAQAAAKWVTENLGNVKDYWILNSNIKNREKNYCSKLIVQAYYYGANVKLTNILNRFISPQYLKHTKNLEKIAVFAI
ncbi:MAG TPA: hypothetical protein H9895_05150 [Candidatus Pseudogracilibacillus intestinigallinarum]|uniref:Permuted papain-like amidase enzyme, YaeF/YiiX, C92 family n=1 Tax=Candidatus Pseudogracilibacillus intestinigallinarum TaxID=2838742 RepID=A0A9D1TJH4_9BACI|nr:hypothetical protein [Candidatus Pseudogracilibacillus intestinigallinarum]